MSIPREDWLHLAQRLMVGETRRFYHGAERRPNMIVSNVYDKYAVYCQACKMGGVVEKEHVRITGVKAPAASHELTLPTDLMRVLDAPQALQHGVLGFLAHKNMDAAYLPELFFSESRKRLMIDTPQGWLGRDTTGSSPQKWLTYNGQNYLAPGWKAEAPPRPGRQAVVVEDPFSFYKVQWALSVPAVFDTYSSLGTKLSDDLILKLLYYKNVVVFYDGDEAGRKGAESQAKRLRAMGVQAVARPAPDGKDPKDMLISEIEFWVYK